MKKWLRDLSLKGIGLLEEEREDSPNDGETSTEILNNNDKHKCSETNKCNYRSDLYYGCLLEFWVLKQ